MILGEKSGIEHIATGGTIDSIWTPEKDTARPAPTSYAADYLRFLSDHGYPSTPSTTLMLKDSQELTVADKRLIGRTVAESNAQKTIMTSGTYLLVDLGRRIQNHPSMRANRFGKVVALVAAITPLEGFNMPDGGFSLGMAHAALEDVDDKKESSVLGVINGVVAPVDVLEKDLTTATFEQVDTRDSLLGYGRYTVVPAGGTIDFEFNGLDGVEPARNSFVPRYLRDQVRSMTEFDATPPILKDSRNLTKEDMDLVVDLVRSAPSEHVLVTSGLLKIATLRTHLANALQGGDDHDRNRRVVLTGSRYMLGSIGRSDAPFNLGYALGKLGAIEPGAHVAVTGRLLDDNEDPLSYAYTPEELIRVSNA